MPAVSLKFPQALFSILGAVLLAAACSDATEPSAGGEAAGTGRAEQSRVAPSTPDRDTTALPGDGATMRQASGAPMNLLGVDRLYPCGWHGAYCYRWFEIDDPVWLELAINYTGGYAIIWERLHGSGQPFQQRYAVNQNNLSVYLLVDQQWHLYSPLGLQTSSTTFVLEPMGECGGTYNVAGILCSHDLLKVPEFLRRLANGT